MNYKVLLIESKQTYPWLLKKHYAKRIPSISWAFGLFQDNVLQGVLTIGKPASPSLCVGVCGKVFSEYVYELNRLCVNEGLAKNTLSYFVSSCLKQLPDLVLVSYADKAQNHTGYIYQATNWIYTGATKERTDIGFEDGTHSRHYEKSTDYKKNRKKRSSKHRYVYFTGGRSFKKKALNALNYTPKPYPKGDNKRYDTSHEVNTQVILF